MNIKGFRRMLFGEKMPDKNDPKYKERYERDVDAGRKFAKATRIDKTAAKVQASPTRIGRCFWLSYSALSSAGWHGTFTA